MTVYDVIYDVCNKKSHRLDKQLDWDDVGLTPYMFQRWVSMTNPMNAFLLNEYTNRIGWPSLENVETAYHMISTFAQPTRKFSYMKKSPQSKQKIDEAKQKEAKRLGLSQKEINSYDKLLKSISIK